MNPRTRFVLMTVTCGLLAVAIGWAGRVPAQDATLPKGLNCAFETGNVYEMKEGKFTPKPAGAYGFEIVDRPHPAARDDRNGHGGRHATNEFDIESFSRTLLIDRGDEHLAGALGDQCRNLVRHAAGVPGVVGREDRSSDRRRLSSNEGPPLDGASMDRCRPSIAIRRHGACAA